MNIFLEFRNVFLGVFNFFFGFFKAEFGWWRIYLCLVVWFMECSLGILIDIQCYY